jgi:3-oxoacyl-[acyl-carrier protein] reductase
VTLEGKGVVVTGGSSGIGRAIAKRCVAAGADVLITYRANRSGADEAARELASTGRRVLVQQADIAREEDIVALARRAREGLGRVDVWINNAGADILTGPGGALPDVEKLDRLLTVDLRGTMLASWEAVRLLAAAGGGVIINMSWDHVLTGMPGRNPEMFAAVKGGVLAFSKSLARTAAPLVRVNVLAPGWIETSFGEGLDEESRRSIAASTPLGRWGTPEDVARAAVFLASSDASFVTGQAILVGGGTVM